MKVSTVNNLALRSQMLLTIEIVCTLSIKQIKKL